MNWNNARNYKATLKWFKAKDKEEKEMNAKVKRPYYGSGHTTVLYPSLDSPKSMTKVKSFTAWLDRDALKALIDAANKALAAGAEHTVITHMRETNQFTVTAATKKP